MSVKAVIYGVFGVLTAIGGAIGQFLGGWDIALRVLCVMMAADYITGILCALVWKKSPKSADGAFESKASVKGLLRKGGMLLVVYISCQLDLLMGTEFIRTASITFFIANDGFSVVENLGIMGLPMPPKFKNAFELLRQKSDENSTAQ